MEDLQINPYYDKYASKIAALQKTAPEEFVERIEKKEKSKNESDVKTAERYIFIAKNYHFKEFVTFLLIYDYFSKI